MKRLPILLVLATVAACSDSLTGPGEPAPDTGIQIENATGSSLTARIIECGFGELAGRTTIPAGQRGATATAAGCWRLDVWTADDRYGMTHVEVATGTLHAVTVRSAHSSDPWRGARVVIDVQD